jgi:DNA-binding IclR family transcriptional regulator
MAPPGPNGTTPRELALRADRDELTVQRLLGDLSELGYVVWLTAEGFAMAHIAERVVLAKFAEEAAPAGAPPARAGG